MGQVITFYSYKGGVGRSMALANIATLMAQWGYKTLLVDWDLEAPGLEYYFQDPENVQGPISVEEIRQKEGLIDLLNNAEDLESKIFSESVNWQDSIITVKVREAREEIHLITAGKRTRDSHYFEKVTSLNWDTFYQHRGGFLIESLRNEWKANYDYVLIDSRTGITDIGGICTVQLPDVLVLLFTATEQSLNGILEVAAKAQKSQWNLPFDRFNLTCLPIPSRFDSNEEFKVSRDWLEIFSDRLKEIYDDWLPISISRKEFLEVTKIPYSSYFSFGEKLPVIEQGTTDPTGLGYAYENITAVIAGDFESIERIIEDRDRFVLEKLKWNSISAQQGDIEHALSLLQQSLNVQERIGDIQGKATTLNSMASIVAQQGDIEHALSLLQQSLNVQERIGDIQGKATTLNSMASIVAQQGDIERALSLWRESLGATKRIGDVQGEAATLSNMASIVAQQGDIERALSLWQGSLDTQERIGDIKGKAATLNRMAFVVAQQGDIERALSLWQESLDSQERIGDVQGKAATLANLAYWAGEQGDRSQQLTLNLQAAAALSQARAYSDLLTVLSNLGFTAEENPISYLAQAIWLMLRIQPPLAKAVNLLNALYQRIDKGDSLEALLGTMAYFLCAQRGEGHPGIEKLQKTSLKILLGAATEQGVDVENMEDLQPWMQAQQLTDPALFLPKLNARLEKLIGDTWAFDPMPLQSKAL